MAEESPTATRLCSHLTAVTGCLPTMRVVTVDEWAERYLDTVKHLLGTGTVRRVTGLVGKWTVELKTNDAHLHQFFCRNWERIPKTATCDVNCYAFTRVTDEETLWLLRGLETEGEREAFLNDAVEQWSSPPFQSIVRDPRLRDLARLPPRERFEAALRAPFALYCPQLAVYVMINTDYYGEVKCHGVLGVLEEALVQVARIDGHGEVANPGEVWLGLCGAGIEYSTSTSLRRGVVILSATPTPPIEYALDVLSVRPENRFHSVDWLFVNVGTGRVLALELAPYVPGSLLPLWPGAPEPIARAAIENAPAELDDIEMPGADAPAAEATAAAHRIVALASSSPTSRLLIDPERLLGYERCSRLFNLTNVIIVVRDGTSETLVESLTPEAFVELVSRRAQVREESAAADASTPPPFLNPYLLRTSLRRGPGHESAVDLKRLACLRLLAALSGVTVSRVNLRFGDAFNCFLLRLAVEWSPLSARLVCGEAITHELCAKLRLVRRQVPVEDRGERRSRRAVFSLDGTEATIVSLASPKHGVIHLAVDLRPHAERLVLSYSRGPAACWTADFETVAAGRLFGTAAAVTAR